MSESVSVDFGNFSGLLLMFSGNAFSTCGLLLILFCIVKCMNGLSGAILSGFELIITKGDMSFDPIPKIITRVIIPL